MSASHHYVTCAAGEIVHIVVNRNFVQLLWVAQHSYAESRNARSEAAQWNRLLIALQAATATLQQSIHLWGQTKLTHPYAPMKVTHKWVLWTVSPRCNWRSLVSRVLDLRCLASWQDDDTALSMKSSANCIRSYGRIRVCVCVVGDKRHLTPPITFGRHVSRTCSFHDLWPHCSPRHHSKLQELCCIIIAKSICTYILCCWGCTAPLAY